MYMNDGNKTKINLRNKSVFITGVAGFIGSNLAKRLLSTVEGVKVVGLDNMNHYYTRLRNKIFRKYKASGYAGVEAIFERDQRNQKFIWGMYDRICGMFCRKTR